MLREVPFASVRRTAATSSSRVPRTVARTWTSPYGVLTSAPRIRRVTKGGGAAFLVAVRPLEVGDVVPTVAGVVSCPGATT